MAAAQQPVAKKLVNFDVIVNLPEAKRVPLLSILTLTDFENPSTFHDQIADLLNRLTLHPENIVFCEDLARTFASSVRSSIFKSSV
jgi:hypothetical protein